MSSPAPPSVPRERPDHSCDVVMRGGITSGVVYPHAVCELATAYRLGSVGGTSAGAIAASVAAAAEYGRENGGYEELAALPEWIGSDGHLAKLFQPQKATRRLYALLLAAISHTRAKPFWVTLEAVRRFPLATACGALPGAALVVLAVLEGDGALQIAAVLGGLLLALAGGAVGLALRLVKVATGALGGNGFGLCSGMPGHGARDQALTPWLGELIDRAARRDPEGEPLTFGHLWAGPDAAPETADPAAAWLRLEMMTTNVTNHRAERWPTASSEYYFSPEALRRLFPARVVNWMVAHPPPLPDDAADRRRQQLQLQQLLPLRPVPHPADLPVIVATRMSLSFPILLSAVPLWRVDFSRTANQAAAKAARAWLREHEREWDEATDDERRALVAGLDRVVAERCWFSDGGISSNFPVHFFDAFVPKHPTVGLNLRGFHPDREPSDDENENVWMPRRHGSGILDWWYRFDGDVIGFLTNVVRTMQNRIDDAQMRVPGYRDRVVHVSLTKTEGGMNLTMEPEVLDALTARGRAAGRRLVDRFSLPAAEPADLSWDHHRWVRLRIALHAISDALSSLATQFTTPPAAGGTDYADLLDGPAPPLPTGYPMSAEQRAKARALTDGIAELVAQLDGLPGALDADGPSPRQRLRAVAEEPLPAAKTHEG